MVNNYSVREMSEEEFMPLFRLHAESVFAHDHSYDIKEVLTDLEKEKLSELGKDIVIPYKLYLGLFDPKGDFVGWSWGQQENRSTFYMTNSAVLEKHRRKGLYSALLQKAVQILSNKGFQLIYSRHNATNNAVIIPKLKNGFIISKMEIDDKFGVLIHLHFYTNDNRRKIMDYRSGEMKPDQKIKEIFKIT